MTQDEIIRMALEACAPNQSFNSDEEWVERFAALVAAHEKKFWTAQIEVECNEAVLAEREACAKVCDEHGFLAKHPPQLSEQDQLRSKK